MERSGRLILDEHPDLALLRHQQRRGICCLVLHAAKEAQTQALLLEGVFCAYREGGKTALLYAQDLGFKGMPALEARLRELGLQGGLSGPFALAASARGCMLKAQLALETGKRVAPGRALYPLEEYGEPALLHAARQAMQQQGFAPEDFCDAALMQMRAMDAEKDTRYVESLYAYLRCGMDMKRAAQQLGVHRNTLAYRMERVQALFELDLRDGSRCFELLFSLWLMHSLPGDAQTGGMEAPFDQRAAQAALWRHVEREAAQAKPENFACVLLCAGVSSTPDTGRLSLISQLRACAPQAAFAFDEDVLLMALPPQELTAYEEEIRRLCAGMGCPVALTQAFSIRRLEQHARLCRMALCAASGLYTRTRDLCSTLLFMALERSTPLTPYVCEDVIRVMDDDAQKGTALSRSLYAYLLHFRDMKRAAQQLGMHRNTMEYHIRKIEALIGSDMDGTHRFMMMCTYKMLALPESGRYGLVL